MVCQGWLSLGVGYAEVGFEGLYCTDFKFKYAYL